MSMQNVSVWVMFCLRERGLEYTASDNHKPKEYMQTVGFVLFCQWNKLFLLLMNQSFKVVNA
jgi:hypothetical protein